MKKRNKKTGAVLAASLLAFSLPLHVSAAAVDSQDMYRLYNPNSGEHFYTASTEERDNLRKVGWHYEGVGWQAPLQSDAPVYRVYNANAGDHHYTVSKAEKDMLVRLGWYYENVGWYSASEKGLPLYRQYNPNAVAGAHNYTTSAGEAAHLVSVGWKDEGIGWYAAGGGRGLTAEEEQEEQKLRQAQQEEDGSFASLESDVTLQGSGSGYHAKLTMSSTTGSAVSFGVQYDTGARVGSGAHFLIESIAPSGPDYIFLGNAQTGVTYKLKLAWYSDNTIRAYVNGQQIYSGRTNFRAVQAADLALCIEGSAKQNGDSINAYFENIKVKAGQNGTLERWDMYPGNYFGLRASVEHWGTVVEQGAFATNGAPNHNAGIRITGTANIPAGYDWDNCFYAVDPGSGTSNHPLSGTFTIHPNI
ncbi:MAG: hypothetical protein Q4B22_11480 [Eubacteriales bacterium]|nr:hypothetical protein [Eubacteriales bacterium]